MFYSFTFSKRYHVYNSNRSLVLLEKKIHIKITHQPFTASCFFWLVYSFCLSSADIIFLYIILTRCSIKFYLIVQLFSNVTVLGNCEIFHCFYAYHSNYIHLIMHSLNKLFYFQVIAYTFVCFSELFCFSKC